MPYPNEHSARLRDPKDFNPKTFRRTNGGTIYGKVKVPKTIAIIWGKLKGKDKPSDQPIPQALRFPTKSWTADKARKWLKDNNIKYLKFEAAAKEKTKADDEVDFVEHDFGCDLTVRNYQVRLETLNEKERSVEAVLSTEDKVLVLDLAGWRIVEEILLMDGLKLPATGQVPMLDSHDRTTVQKQLGSIRDFQVQGKRLIGKKVFSSSPIVDHAWQLTKEGHLTDNSIGYNILNSTIVERGQEMEVAGRIFKASTKRDLRVVTKWELKESSVLPIGADGRAKNRAETNIFKRKDKKMEEFEKWLKERGFKIDELSEQQRESLQADFEAEQERQEADVVNTNPPEPKVEKEEQRTEQAQQTQTDPVQAANEAVTKERERVNAIRELAGDDVPAETVEQCIREGTSVKDAKGIFLEAIRKNRPSVGSAPAAIVHDGQIRGQMLEDAILLRAGFEAAILLDKTTGEQRAEQAHKYRDMSLIDICRHALIIEGKEIPVGREEMIRAAFSTVSLPEILGNVANKSLLKGYETPRETWRSWCQIGSVPDFKQVTRARLTDSGELEEVPPSGEVKHGGAEEEAEKYNIATYAKNFGINRQHIINDDLGAFTRTPARLGRSAKLLIAKLVYVHLLANGNMSDSVALFHATHKNLNTSNALNSDHLGTAIAAFRKQTDKAGNEIDIEPAILLVPPDLEQTAKELLQSDYIIAAGSTDVLRPSKNIHKGTLQLEVESRLSNSKYSGYSITTWYVMGSPNDVDTIEVAFLNGIQVPTLERFNPGANVLGIVFRTYIDVGCKSLDFRGMQKNTA